MYDLTNELFLNRHDMVSNVRKCFIALRYINAYFSGNSC